MGGSWRQAMTDALYGAGGFYTTAGAPSRHFRTAAQVGLSWSAAIAELARRVDRALGSPADFAVVDVGAGGGELLSALTAIAPARWRLTGVDVASRPPHLPDRVDWLAEPPASVTGLLIAVELLDVVPVDLVELTATGPRLIEVDPHGEERLGGPVDDADSAWLSHWWPSAQTGERTEIGRTRDELWATLRGSVSRGAAVAVDYGRTRSGTGAASLAAFRDGHAVRPVPDGSCDLTAHVCFESLRQPGDLLLSQREALSRLGIQAARPRYDGDPASYLAAMSACGEAAELLDPDGLGGFDWLVHPVAIENPLALRRSTRGTRTSARTSPTRR